MQIKKNYSFSFFQENYINTMNKFSFFIINNTNLILSAFYSEKWNINVKLNISSHVSLEDYLGNVDIKLISGSRM